MSIQMYKGKEIRVVDNRDVRKHQDDGWTFKPSKTAIQQKISRKKPKVSPKVEPVVAPTTKIDLPGPEDFDFKIEE